MPVNWKNYKPMKQCWNQTLYEICESIYEQYHFDYPFDTTDKETLIRNECLQRLTEWLFNNTSTIDFNTDVWKEFIKQFMITFLNREISYKDPYIFRMKLIQLLVTYQNFLETNASNAYSEMNKALGSLMESGTKNYSDKETGNRKDVSTVNNTANTTLTTTQDTTGNTKITGNSDSTIHDEGTSLNDVTSSGTTTSDGTNNTTIHNTGNTSENDYSRQLFSDTPQSIISKTTSGNPELRTWDYATNLTDTNGNKTGTSSNDGTNNTTLHNEGTDKSTSNTTGSTTNDTTTSTNDAQTTTSSSNLKGNQTNELTSNTSGNNTSDNVVDKVGGESYNNTKDILTPFEMSEKRYRFFIEYMKNPIYNVLDNLDILFISFYIDECRMGWIDWDEYSKMLDQLFQGVI